MFALIEKLIISVLISIVVAIVTFIALQYVLFVLAFAANMLGFTSVAVWLRNKAYGIQTRLKQTFNFILRK